MKAAALMVLCGVLLLTGAAGAEEPFPELSKRIPHFAERLRSGRWEARYCLLSALEGTDAETRRALETLTRDAHGSVANQALVRYEHRFLRVDRALFRPSVYAPRCFPVDDLPEKDPERALVDHCLGLRTIPPPHPFCGTDPGPLRVLDPARPDDPAVVRSLTLVGILGQQADAKALEPFLGSSNPYVALGAAKAVIRLGEEAKGREALIRLAQFSLKEHEHYVLEALRLLREIGHTGLPELVRRILASIDSGPRLEPRTVSAFLVFAADILGPEVWTPPAGAARDAGPK